MKSRTVDYAKWAGIAIFVAGVLWKSAVWMTNVNNRLERMEQKIDRLDPDYGPPSR